MAGEALVVILNLSLELGVIESIVVLDTPCETSALDRLRTEVVEALQAQLPRAEVEHQKIPLIHVGGDEEIERGRLVDVRRPVSLQLDKPPLVDLKARAEHPPAV